MSTERLIGVGVLVGVLACDGGTSAGDTEGGTGTSGDTAATSGTSAGPASDTGSAQGSGEDDAGPSGDTSGDDTSAGDTAAEGGLPEGDGCCDAHAGPGCNEQGVAVCVCAESPECCVFDWFETCADLAQSACEATCETDESGGTETDSDTAGMACDETVLIQLGASDAQLSGAWVQSTSQAGEGEIVIIDFDQGVGGEVLWDIDVPCDDTWTIWVRLFDQGQDDSFFATLDGEPRPPAIFEGGIIGPGQGWNWRALNWRDPDDPATFIEDPWAPQWGAGTHALALSYRESVAVARIEVTNDPRYEP